MRVDNEKTIGDLIVTDELEFHGMVTGSIKVAGTGLLMLHGMCCGDLLVEPGSRVDVHGTVIGTLVNRGGAVRVFGVLGGLRDDGRAETSIDPAAVIGPRPT